MTPKQQRFVAEYLISLNATDAARKAGYSAKGASTEGERLLRKAEIRAAVAEGQAKQLGAAGVTAERVLEELARVGLSDLGEMFDEHGKLKPLHKLPKTARVAISSVKVTKKNLTVGDGVMDDVVEVRLWDKVRALEALAKRFGLVQDQVRVTVTLEDLVAGSLERGESE